MKINTYINVIYLLSQDEGQKGNSGQKQKSKWANLSPLIMPVSVPVSVTHVLDPQASTHQVMF